MSQHILITIYTIYTNFIEIRFGIFRQKKFTINYPAAARSTSLSLIPGKNYFNVVPPNANEIPVITNLFMRLKFFFGGIVYKLKPSAPFGKSTNFLFSGKKKIEKKRKKKKL